MILFREMGRYLAGTCSLNRAGFDDSASLLHTEEVAVLYNRPGSLRCPEEVREGRLANLSAVVDNPHQIRISFYEAFESVVYYCSRRCKTGGRPCDARKLMQQYEDVEMDYRNVPSAYSLVITVHRLV